MIGAAILACAVALPASLDIGQVIRVESGGDPIAVSVNVDGTGQRQHPTNPTDAAASARRFIAAGYSVDLGLTQINSRNLAHLGLTVEQALDPCANVRGGSTILAEAFASAAARFGGEQAALAALSLYNTGSFSRGFENGYVARYASTGNGALRQISANHGVTGRDAPRSATAGHDMPLADNPYTADTAVFIGVKINVRIE